LSIKNRVKTHLGSQFFDGPIQFMTKIKHKLVPGIFVIRTN